MERKRGRKPKRRKIFKWDDEKYLKFVDYDDLTSGERNCFTDTYDTTLEARKTMSSFFDLTRRYAEECALKGSISSDLKNDIQKHLEVDLE